MQMFYNPCLELLVLKAVSGQQYIFDVPVECSDCEMEDLSEQAVCHQDEFFTYYSPSEEWELVDVSGLDWRDHTHEYITLRYIK